MLNSEHLSLVNKIGDKTEFTITRVHCTLYMSKIARMNLNKKIWKELIFVKILG